MDDVDAPALPRSHRTHRDRKRRADRDPSLVRRALARERAVLMTKRRAWKRLAAAPPPADDAPPTPPPPAGASCAEEGGWVLVGPPARARGGLRAWLRRVSRALPWWPRRRAAAA